jgi:hypothetical protein
VSAAKIVSACVFICLALLSGCGTVPSTLARPAPITCAFLAEPISHDGKYGLLNIPWETRLEKGPYLSEWEDSTGTYYRAPPGGISYSVVGDPNHNVSTRDGGFYIPKNANEIPKIYVYFSVANTPAQIPTEGTDCSNVAYISEPSTSKLSLVSIGIEGAAGGAAGTKIGHPTPGGGMVFHSAPGVGAAGGLIGGLIVAEIVNANVGNIEWTWPIQDQTFVEKLRGLAATAVPLKELPARSVPK